MSEDKFTTKPDANTDAESPAVNIVIARNTTSPNIDIWGLSRMLREARESGQTATAWRVTPAFRVKLQYQVVLLKPVEERLAWHADDFVDKFCGLPLIIDPDATDDCVLEVE